MTTAFVAGSASNPAVPSLPAARPDQDPLNRVEEVLIHRLMADVVDSLTDRSGGDHEHPWTPEQRVRVGVLGFTVTPPAPPDGSVGDADEDTDSQEDRARGGGGGLFRPAAARPIDNPGVLGLDFVVTPDIEASTLRLACTVDYALYQQLFPTYAAVHALAQEIVAAMATAAANVTFGEGSARPDGPPSPLTVDGVAERTHAANDDSPDENSGADGPPDDGAARGRHQRRRRPTVRIRPTWRRYDRHVTFDIEVDLAGDDETMGSSRDLAGGDPLVIDAEAAVTDHYQLADAARRLSGPQTISVQAASDGVTYQRTLRERIDANWVPQAPRPELTVIAVPTVNGDIAVSVSLVNRTNLLERPFQDLALYDSKLVVTVIEGGVLARQCLAFAEDDCRYRDAATVAGRGRGCVAVADETDLNGIRTETLPIYSQPVSRPRVINGADVSFAALARDPAASLGAIAVAMRAFLDEWSTTMATDADEVDFLGRIRHQFEEEVERFELGCDLLLSSNPEITDPRLLRAFKLANEAFAQANPGPSAGWRLFQLVFIVSQLAGLVVRTRPDDPRLRAELDAVDVLWFPTGGGKTEAYLGLIATATFYDRLRGKERGHTAWLLFPLRMLSVQQLARMEAVLHHAEAVRVRENLGGDPFTLGYLVGSGNTPNRLGPEARNGWWPGLVEFASHNPEERDRRRLVGMCHACGDPDSVGLDADVAAHRLLHRCRVCGHVLPIHASDEEVFRYASTVIVSTVDKIASFAFQGELTEVNRGPTMGCPAHGWYSFGGCGVPGCTTASMSHFAATGFVDPVPALWIQDELHLVREDLGVFAGHYHTLLAELARGAGVLPSKVLAATATIEQYEDQLRQVYGRHPRMFPTGGPTLERSFYAETTPEVRRVHLGVLPHGGGTAKVDLSGELMQLLIDSVHHHSDDPAPLAAELAAAGAPMTPDELVGVLFDYELVLAYVNSKAQGVLIADDVQDLSDRYVHAGKDRIVSDFLSGETPIGDLAKIVAAITGAEPTAPPRGERYRALVGTAVISHGVDLTRLNLQVVAGMPSSYAHYIQATSRAGRAHVGLIITIFDRFNRRETSVFHSFLTAHAAIERMVEPVPVNRYASRAVERTLPGVVCALLWDEAREPANGAPPEGIGMTRRFKPWWNTIAETLNPKLIRRIRAAYSSPVGSANSSAQEAKLADDAEERWDYERQRMQQWGADFLTDLFSTGAMTSLRDVEAPVEFGGGARAEQVVERLFPSVWPAPLTTGARSRSALPVRSAPPASRSRRTN